MKLSIITVNLNNRDGLKKTLDSVASQTWRDFEHIIIDGASTDGSVEVIKEYDERNANSQQPVSKVQWLSEKDTGIYNAMNKGIRMAQGEYCFFLNSGDYLVDASSLEKFFSVPFTEDVVYGYLKFDRGGQLEQGSSPKEVTLRTFVEGTIHHTGNSFIRRDAFDRWGLYDERLKIVSDWKWFLQSLGLGDATYRYIDVNLSVFDCTGISENQGELLSKERLVVLNQLVPYRILKDYMDRLYIEERFYEQELKIRGSLAYKIVSAVIRPIKTIKKWINH